MSADEIIAQNAFHRTVKEDRADGHLGSLDVIGEGKYSALNVAGAA